MRDVARKMRDEMYLLRAGIAELASEIDHMEPGEHRDDQQVLEGLIDSLMD